MYIVEMGTLVVTKFDHGAGPVNILIEGDYFGELALMDDESSRRSATVTTSSKCRLLKIPKETFDDILMNRRVQKEVRRHILDYNQSSNDAHRLHRYAQISPGPQHLLVGSWS
jgi:CRP-like cAMP-binding protein